MSQAEVMEFLTNHKGWYSSKEIATILKVSTGRIITNVQRLRTSGFIEFRIRKNANGLTACYEYKYK